MDLKGQKILFEIWEESFVGPKPGGNGSQHKMNKTGIYRINQGYSI